MITATFLLLIVNSKTIFSYVPQYESNGRYKVYELQASTQDQFNMLQKFQEQGLIDLWHAPASPNAKTDIMVDEGSPDIKVFHDFLESSKIKKKILVDDLSKFIEEKEMTNHGHANKTFSKWLREESLNLRRNSFFGLQMGEYHSYNEILQFMDRIQQILSPDFAAIRSIGRTNEGREIKGIQFGRPRDLTRKVVWIEAGIHAREWTAIHTAVYFIQHIANELQAGADRSQLARYLESVDVLIFPCLNPDGYEFTRTDPRNPSVRFWRKSRSLERCGFLNGVNSPKNRRCCKGVDLNRNFDFRFAETGTSYFPCSEIYHGAGPFSEPETRAVRDAILNSDLQGRVASFIDLHAYSQLWIYPYSHKRFTYPPDIDDLKAVARRAVSAIGEKFGTHYMYGTGPEIIYAYTGGSADWAKQTAKIKYTFTIELRPSYMSWNGFVLDKTQLIPTARETFDGIMVVFETLVRDLNVARHQQIPSPTTTALPATTLSVQTPSTVINSRIIGESRRSSGILFDNISRSPPPKCEDQVTYCELWLSHNPALCRLSRVSMEQNCRRSCNFCT